MTTRKRKPNPRRAQLKALSQTIKPLVKSGMYASVNEGIQEIYSEETGQSVWNTYKGWIDQGQKVSKGEHGFPIWAKKRALKAKEDQEQEPSKQWFPIAYILHEGQVQAA